MDTPTLIVVQNGHLGFSVTQRKPLLRAATVGFSSFWDSRAVIFLVLPCVCCPTCQSVAAFLYSNALGYCTASRQTEAHFSALCLIKVLLEAFVVVGEAVN